MPVTNGKRLPLLLVQASFELVEPVHVHIKLVGLDLEDMVLLLRPLKLAVTAALLGIGCRHHGLKRHHLPLNHDLLVGSPGVVAVADPWAVEAAAAAAGLCAAVGDRVMFCVLMLAPVRLTRVMDGNHR